MIRIDPAQLVREAAAAREEAKTTKAHYDQLKREWNARIRLGEENTEAHHAALSAAGDAHINAYHKASEKAQQAYALLSFIRTNAQRI